MTPGHSGDPLPPPVGKPLWLMTLADLALLLVGFLVLIQATTDRDALARGLRDAFGRIETAPIPVAAAVASFAPGSAVLTDPATLVSWARTELRDPRVTITVTGAAEASEGVLLAVDRARAVLAALVAADLPAERLQLATARSPGRRATLTLAFAGEPKAQP
ncbi:MAG: hypothetical protein JWN21_538 [Sphingomonas bacterium]|uniref:flagellar motor protein MotB n=1 Tax=Sphingomonas bacterium TaxID=1895847 RepID=UPI0026183B02|nr:flagellar motor protein MotB [Sphingomonas bacterium]MDB5694995.1 hypothetical protein [Sphingomonas bacterium]